MGFTPFWDQCHSCCLCFLTPPHCLCTLPSPHCSLFPISPLVQPLLPISPFLPLTLAVCWQLPCMLHPGALCMTAPWPVSVMHSAYGGWAAKRTGLGWGHGHFPKLQQAWGLPVQSKGIRGWEAEERGRKCKAKGKPKAVGGGNQGAKVAGEQAQARPSCLIAPLPHPYSGGGGYKLNTTLQ